MRRIITALLVLLTTSAIAQNGGQITGKKNSGLTGTVMVDSVALKVSDSASRVYQSAIKLKTDSIYTRIGNGLTTTISGVAKKTLGTQVVSADTGLVVNAVMHGITTGGGGGYVDVKVNPSGALTVDATLDSATQRSTMKISNFPATQAVSGTFYQATQPVSIASMPSTPVTGTFWQTTQPVSFTRLKISTDSLIANLDVTDSTNLAGINSKLGSTLTVGSHAVTNAGTFAVQVDSATQRSTIKVSNFPATQPISGSVTATLDSATQRKGVVVLNTVPISGSITATTGATAIFDSTWSSTSMTVTSLNSLASSATVGWQSDSVRNNVRKAVDYKINVKLTMANTAPANDKAVYVYICPFYFDGTNWYAASQGTTTLPTGAQGASTIASPNNLRLLGVLSYTTQNQVCQDNFLLSNAFGNVMPDAFSIIIVNFSGAAISASSNVVNYSPINKVQR